jgi:hypothetical protein
MDKNEYMYNEMEESDEGRLITVCGIKRILY